MTESQNFSARAQRLASDLRAKAERNLAERRHTHVMGDPDDWHVVRCTICGLAASVEFIREQCRYPAKGP